MNETIDIWVDDETDIIVDSGFVIRMVRMCYATLLPITTTGWDGKYFTIWSSEAIYYLMPLSFLSRLTPDVITLGYMISVSNEWHMRLWIYKLKGSIFICDRRNSTFGVSDAEKAVALRILAAAI